MAHARHKRCRKVQTVRLDAGFTPPVVYLKMPCGGEPEWQFRQFTKIEVKPGVAHTQTTLMFLDERDLSMFDVRTNSWQICRGMFTLGVTRHAPIGPHAKFEFSVDFPM